MLFVKGHSGVDGNEEADGLEKRKCRAMLTDIIFICLILGVVFYILKPIRKTKRNNKIVTSVNTISVEPKVTQIANRENFEDTLEFVPVLQKNLGITLLVIADTHGHLQHEVLEKVISVKPFDLCVLLGDIFLSDLQIISEIIPKEKIIGVLGNHDSFFYLSKFGIKNVNADIYECSGVRFLGVEGCVRYRNDRPGYSQEECCLMLRNAPAVDIIISHASPYLMHDVSETHAGYKGVTQYLFEKQVPLCIHGHNHTDKTTKLKNGTLCHSVYGIKVLTL